MASSWNLANDVERLLAARGLAETVPKAPRELAAELAEQAAGVQRLLAGPMTRSAAEMQADPALMSSAARGLVAVLERVLYLADDLAIDLAQATRRLADEREPGRGDRPGPVEPSHADALGDLAALLVDQQRFADAEPILREARSIERVRRPRAEPVPPRLTMLLAAVLYELGQEEEASRMASEAVGVLRFGREAPDDETRRAGFILGQVLTGRREWAKAEGLLLSYAEIAGVAGRPPAAREAALSALVALYDGWGRADEAARWRAARTARS